MKPPNRQEQNSVLKDCSERLEKLGIDYMLTGSTALVHYVPRNRVREAISRNRLFSVLNQQVIIKIDCVVRMTMSST